MTYRAEYSPGRAVSIVAIAVLVASCASTCRAEPVTVTLHEEAIVAGGPVTLGQLADIAAETEAGPQLAAVIIGSSPLPGRARRISAGYIRMRIARAGISADIATLSGASAVVVRAKSAAPLRPRAAASPVRGPATGKHAARPATRSGSNTPADEPWACKRGQRVRIRVLCGSIVVVTNGQLLENAAAWELVMARVGSTGGKVCGVLSGPRELTVRL